MLTSKQRAYVRSLSNGINSIMQVGKNGVTPEVTAAVSEAFNTRELVKISILKNCMEDARDIAEIISERTRSEVVCVIGKKIVFYKPFKDKPVIELPK